MTTGKQTLLDALRHDAEIVAGVRHNEDRVLHGTRFGEGVLKLIEAVESTAVEVMHKSLMERVPTGDPARYSTHRSLWELAKHRREAAFAYLAVPTQPEVFCYAAHDPPRPAVKSLRLHLPGQEPREVNACEACARALKAVAL